MNTIDTQSVIATLSTRRGCRTVREPELVYAYPMYSRPAPHSAIALSHAAAVAVSSPVPALTASKSLKHVVFLSFIKSLVLGSCVGTARLVKVSSVGHGSLVS